MLNEFFKNIVNFLTAVNIDGETNINNSLTVLSSLEVQPNNSHTTLYVTNSTVGINTQFPNVEFTVNGSISSNFVIYDGLGNSGNWNSTSTLVKDKSANWDSVYSTYNKNSSDYTKYNYVNNSFLPLSGGIVTGITQFNNNVTIWGVLSATGGTYFSNTIYSTTSAISVIHVGAGPALFVGSIGTGDIASFYDLDQNVEMLHIGGHDGDYPNVGIKTSYPNKDFTVNGEISASRIIWTPNGNSDLWNTTYNNQTNYLPLSGGTMTGKLVATANLTASKLNIGNAIGTPSPTTVSDGDVWISNQNKFAWKSNGNAIYAAGLSQSNTFNNTQIIGASTPLTLLTVGNTGGGSAAVFTAQGPNNVVRITQTGSGNALVVEDEANPDSNPFVINNMGSVGIGLSSLSGIDAKLTVIGNVSATGSYFGDGSKLTGIVAGDTVATTLVRNNSANWDSVYSTYNKNSATYATIEFSNNKFLPLSGGTITGDLIVDNTLQVGDGPNFDFIITEEGNVGINTETPNEKLTVVGNISCTGFLYGDGSKLTGIVAGDTVATTLVRNNSANWDSVYTTVTLNSAINWNYQGTDLKQLSANWELAYNTRNLYLPLSGGIITGNLEVGEGNPVILFIGDEVVGVNTEQPNEALTVVGNISATGNIYTNGKIISGGIDISSLFNSGGGGTGIDTGVRSLTANWENTYTTVQSNSSSWNPILNSGYLSLSGGTLSGKLTVATTITSSKLNIGNAIPIFAPATTVDGDVWITNQSKLAWRANGHLIVASSVSQINTFTQPQVIQSSNNTSAALRITQTGLGNALLVDDDTHPDRTPFVIDNIGSVGIGLSSLSGIDAKLTVIGNVSATGSYFGDGSKLTGIVAGDTVATTLVRNNSANWDSVYTTVQNNSAINWDNSLLGLYTNSNFLPLSGGTLTGKLNLSSTAIKAGLNIGQPVTLSVPYEIGDLWRDSSGRISYALSTNVAATVAELGRANFYTQNQTIFSNHNTSPALRITQTGLGNALLVDDDTHPDSTPFVIDNIGSVGIGLSSLSGIDAKLTVIGNVSATGSYFGDGSKLTGIVAGDTVATTLVRNNSANWDSVYTSVKNTSGNWDSLYTNVNVNSAIWGSQTNNATLSGLILNNLDTYQIGFAGDSIAQAYGTVDFSSSPFAWYCFYLNPKSKRILWDPRLAYNNVSPFNTLNPSGGYNFARGGEATQDLTRQLNLIQQRVPDILVLQIGTNNGFGTLADCDTRFSETTAFLVGVFNTGVKHCIVFPVPPKSTTNSATVVRLTNEYNKRLENYCKTNIKKMSFFDNYEFLVNPASEFYRPLGVFNGSSQTSVTVDGTHPSTFGSFRVANKVEDTLLKDLPTIKFKATNPGDAWDATNNIRGNLFGRNGIMFSESGTAGLSTGWTLTNGTGLIATPTRVLSQAYSGYTMQKLTFSGTPTSNTDQVRLAYTATNNSFFNRGFTNHYFELVFRPISFNNLHLPGVQIQILGGAGTSDTYSIGGGGGSGGLVAKLCPVQDGYFHVYSTRPLISNNTNNQFQIFVNINGLNGIPASGELEVGFVGLWGVS